MTDLAPSAKFVLRELEHADEPLSRGRLADTTRLSYSTVADAVRALQKADAIETVPDDTMRFKPADDYEIRNMSCI